MNGVIPAQENPDIKIVIKRNGQNRMTGELTTRYDTLYLSIPYLYQALNFEYEGIKDCSVVECSVYEGSRD